MSIASEQARAIIDGFLDNIGEDAAQSRVAIEALPILDQILAAYGKAFGEAAAKDLQLVNAVDTGELQTSLTFSVTKNDSVYELTVGYPRSSKAAVYYDYVNKGVKGIESSAISPQSPYQFKKKIPAPVMLRPIEAWVQRHSLTARNEDQKHNLSTLQNKRKTVRKMAEENGGIRSIAYAIASRIKLKGLRATGYFDNAVKEVFGQDFLQVLAETLGAEVRLEIRNYAGNA